MFLHNKTVPKHIKHTEKYKIDNKQVWYSFTVLVYLMYYNISLQNLPFQLISKQIVHTKYESQISGTWELLLCKYWRKRMIIG